MLWPLAFIRAQTATGTSQRIEGRFARNPEGDPKSRLWVAVAGRGYGYPNGSARRRICGDEVASEIVYQTGGVDYRLFGGVLRFVRSTVRE